MELKKLQDHKHNRRRRRTNIEAYQLEMTDYNYFPNHYLIKKKLSNFVPTILSSEYKIICHHLFLSLSLLILLLLLQTPTNTNAQLLNNQLQLQQQPPVASAATTQSTSYLLPGNNMENLRIPELQPVGSIIYQLKAVDKFNDANRKITYALTGDTFSVDEDSGEVKLMKQLDREKQAQISTVVNVLGSNLDQPLESRRRIITIEDVDDSYPIFGQHKYSIVNNQQLGQYIYQVSLSEQVPISTIVLGELLVTDADEGINADVVFECRPRQSTNNACDTFSIESRRIQSGKYLLTIKTKSLLDSERVQQYKLTLIARGKRPSPLKGVPLEAEAIINIQVENIQDEGPVFVNAPYALSMHEGLKPGTRLLTLIVQDGDLAPQRELSMIVVDGPYKEYFQVTKDPEISRFWYLETNQTIDRESLFNLQSQSSGSNSNNNGNIFTINLLAAELDESGSPLASEMELMAAMRDLPSYQRTTLKRENVTIVVLDLPDSRPIFVHTSASPTNQQVDKLIENNFLIVNVSESIVSGASIPNLDLSVMDLDQGINSRFKLSLVDAEVGPQASNAIALESEIIHGRSEVVLNVLNSSLLDYEEPAFRTYRFSLVASKSSSLLPLLANSNNNNNNNDAALLATTPPLVQILEIQMNILDANDNWPEFDRDQYIVSVPEGSPPGYVVAVIRAKDRDSGINGRVDYMLRGSGASKFKLLSSEGKILVNDCGVAQCLDYESQASYSLTYEARDGGGQTRNVSVIINILDINDHVPKFTETIYKRELISDNMSSKQNYISPQLIVRARDLDGPTQGRNNITYSIKWSNLTGLDIDPHTGLVYLSQPLDLDLLLNGNGNGNNIMRDHQQQQIATTTTSTQNQLIFEQQRNKVIVFEAEVGAQDNGSPQMNNSSATILLTVKGNRDGAPQFKQDIYIAYVRENQPQGKAFYQVQALDPDDKDSQLRYSLGYDQNDLLQIDSQSGELSFKQPIAYDDFKSSTSGQLQPYNITVYATDNSRPYPLKATALVSILVQDVNNKRPKFEQLEYKSTLIQGQTKVGDLIMQVLAKDLDNNAQLNYTLLTETILFTDRNGGQVFKLDDIANITSGYLYQLARQERLQLIMDFKQMFAIDRKTGSIELKLEPDYSFIASISFQVKVIDLNQEVFTQLGELQQDFTQCNFFLQQHIDKSPVLAPPSPWLPSVNFNSTFKSTQRNYYNYNLSILEELPLETQIFSLLAKDPQTNQRIEMYEKVFDSDARDYFRVDRSGLILINKRIDYEELPTNNKKLTLSVKALTSEALYSIAHLNIQILDLNDNAPQFDNQSYKVSISELFPYGQDILTINAHDKDSNEFNQIYYSLSGYQSELFQVHQRKGVLSLKKGVKLDRDTEANYYLWATASDCNETIAKSSFPNDLSSQLDRGTASAATTSTAINLKSQISNICKKSTVPVEIILLDENDNDPIFLNLNKRTNELEATVSETIATNSVIAQMQAKDLDEASNGQVSYEIVKSNDEQISQLFKIDSDGFISAQASLSGLGRAQPYRITVRAYDNGPKLSRQSYATLLLYIKDVVQNDGIPKFLRPKQEEIVLLSENVGPNAFVYQVQAVDPDEEANGKLMYKFIQPSDTFDIDPFDGVIKTQNRNNFYLDREQVENYTLIIVAQDFGQPPKQAHRILTIKITDINDNEPYFEREINDLPLILSVKEEISKDTLIGTIQAIDKDEGQNALIGYEIIDGNQNNLFKLIWSNEQENLLLSQSSSSLNATNKLIIGNNPCRIFSNGRLDREQQASYGLTIKVSSMSRVRNQLIPAHLRDPLTGGGGRANSLINQYDPNDLTKLRVIIRLLDINDNKPIFSDLNPKSIVDSSAEIYSQLMVLEAQDADSSSLPIQYSILDAFYFSNSKLNLINKFGQQQQQQQQVVEKSQQQQRQTSLKHVFDIDSRSGILRNSHSLRSYTDGYFEVYIKADSGQYYFESQQQNNNNFDQESKSTITTTRGELELQQQINNNKCSQTSNFSSSPIEQNNLQKENCFVAITKAIVFVTHQRETFRFVFNKTKLNDRLDEFKEKVQQALEEIMFEPVQAQASYGGNRNLNDLELAGSSSVSNSLSTTKAERVVLNTFQTDFYERDDGSLDFSTITSCSQLVKFDDRNSIASSGGGKVAAFGAIGQEFINYNDVPNQVVNYDEVLQLLKVLNSTNRSQQQQVSSSLSLFNQYGLVKIERCLPDKTMYKMTLVERLALYLAALIALVSILLAFIVSRMRKSYEKNLKILQRSKYHYGMAGATATSPFATN